jgi:quercetin dioxygenase-like cupin family protein
MPFIHDVEPVEILPGMKGRFVHSRFMTIAYWEIAKGTPLGEHSHPHEQVLRVESGAFELNLEGKTEVMGPGMVAVIPPNALHSGKALAACRITDTFHPVREDYKL